MAYLLLFSSALLAATFLPLSSEVVLASLLLQGYSTLLLWLVATVGNTLGSLVNWAIGRFLLHFQDREWFPVSSQQLARAQGWFQYYGRWSLLFAWMPFGGDALPLVAGIMRVPVIPLLLLCGTGKALRYAVLIYLIA
jgi:membrane protein YqaA with SNARE-associated domain